MIVPRWTEAGCCYSVINRMVDASSVFGIRSEASLNQSRCVGHWNLFQVRCRIPVA